jgi:hypothetical protein
MMKKLLIICLIFIITQPVLSQEFAKVGRSGVQFLEIGLSPRFAAMGEAGVSLVDDASAVFWNPGALVNVKNMDVAGSYVKWPADIVYSGASLAKTISRIGTFAIHLSALTMGDMRVRTPFYPEGNGQMFTVSDFSAGITYARELTNKFSFGATYKIIFEKYWTFESQGWAVDIGTLYRTGFKSLVLGMSILNFGPEMNFNGHYADYANVDANGEPIESDFEAYDLPLTFKFGMSMNLIESTDYVLTGAVDGIHPNDNKTRLNMGLEACFRNTIALRAGYKMNYDEDSFCAGLGFNIPYKGYTMRLDYSYNDMGLLEGVHRGGFGISF